MYDISLYIIIFINCEKYVSYVYIFFRLDELIIL